MSSEVIEQPPHYQFRETNSKPNTIVLNAGQDEMLKITPTGFYVRGVAVEQGAGEAAAVYQAFKQWMVWASLTRK